MTVSTVAPEAMLFPPGTHVGQDREGNRVHVEDVVEFHDPHLSFGETVVLARGVVYYDPYWFAFAAKVGRCSFMLGPRA